MFVVGFSSQSPVFVLVNKLTPRQLGISRAFFEGIKERLQEQNLMPDFVEDVYRFRVPESKGVPETIAHFQAIEKLLDAVIAICDAADRSYEKHPEKS